MNKNLILIIGLVLTYSSINAAENSLNPDLTLKMKTSICIDKVEKRFKENLDQINQENSKDIMFLETFKKLENNIPLTPIEDQFLFKKMHDKFDKLNSLREDEVVDLANCLRMLNPKVRY